MNKAHYRQQVVNFLEKAHIRLTEEEKARIEIASFGLPDYPRSGLQLLTYCNSERYCAKELVLFPIRFALSIGIHRLALQWVSKKLSLSVGEVYLFVDDDSLTLNKNESGNRFALNQKVMSSGISVTALFYSNRESSIR